MGNRADWEEIGRLGGGGQSEVFLVRSPGRASERKKWLVQIRAALDGDMRAELANAVWQYARPDEVSELAALKVFKIPPQDPQLPSAPPGTESYEAIERLNNEVRALKEGLPGLPKLLDYNVAERWIVTEYFPEGTLENSCSRYLGSAARAMRAFRSLVQTVVTLHEHGYVHRDIKPANVFVRQDDSLVLGDFGIVYVPNAERLTKTGEKVGPRDYMPPWAHLGVRLEKVEQNFDVYMLGKLLWAMVDGRSMLPREYHHRPDFDLTKKFSDDPDMHLVNQVLDNCVVEQPEKCISSRDLLLVVETILRTFERGGQLLKHHVPRPCHVCGNGFYQPHDLRQSGTPQGASRDNSVSGVRFWVGGSDITSVPVQVFACSYCGHVQLFKTTP